MKINRPIVEIDREKCDGCGRCVISCAEGALEIVDGKARLTGEFLCDGLGACIGECPRGALRIVVRESEAFDGEAARTPGGPVHGEATSSPTTSPHAGITTGLSRHRERLDEDRPGVLACGCPSSKAVTLQPGALAHEHEGAHRSHLAHWPVKLALLNPSAPFLRGSHMVLIADCSAAALYDLHTRILSGRTVAMACPKLDDADRHAVRLSEILRTSPPSSLTVVRMEVPCCGGLERIAVRAAELSGAPVPMRRMVIGRTGEVIEEGDIPLTRRVRDSGRGGSVTG